jgi:hypothetical protein
LVRNHGRENIGKFNNNHLRSFIFNTSDIGKEYFDNIFNNFLLLLRVLIVFEFFKRGDPILVGVLSIFFKVDLFLKIIVGFFERFFMKIGSIFEKFSLIIVLIFEYFVLFIGYFIRIKKFSLFFKFISKKILHFRVKVIDFKKLVKVGFL